MQAGILRSDRSDDINIMKKTVKAIMLSLCFLMGCTKDEIPDPFLIEGISMDNYPKVDCSTSTSLLQKLIACKLLGVGYDWQENMLFGGYYDLNINYDDLPGSYEFFKNLRVSTTHGAFMNLIKGDVDLIVTSRSISRDEKAYADEQGVTLDETAVALDGFIFITHKNNSVKSLTREQIQGIYMGEITNWKEVGGRDLAITPYIREPNSGSQEKMETIVMKGLEMPKWKFISLLGMGGPFDRLRYDESGICYSLYYYNRFFMQPDLVNQLAVDGIAPTQQAIRDRTYPYTTEVYTAIRSDTDKNSMAYRLYRLLCSDKAKKIIEESGYVPR